MCHYITASLSKGSDIAEIANIFGYFGIGCEVIDNAHLKGQLPDGSTYISTTRNYCDCGTELGSLREKGGYKTSWRDRELKKLHKQGWSNARIERWLTEKEVARANSDRKSEKVRASTWIECIRSVLESGKTHRVGILLHWYCGSPDSERIALKTTVTTPIDDVTSELLLTMDEDTLYTFTLR